MLTGSVAESPIRRHLPSNCDLSAAGLKAWPSRELIPFWVFSSLPSQLGRLRSEERYEFLRLGGSVNLALSMLYLGCLLPTGLFDG